MLLPARLIGLREVTADKRTITRASYAAATAACSGIRSLLRSRSLAAGACYPALFAGIATIVQDTSIYCDIVGCRAQVDHAAFAAIAGNTYRSAVSTVIDSIRPPGLAHAIVIAAVGPIRGYIAIYDDSRRHSRYFDVAASAT